LELEEGVRRLLNSVADWWWELGVGWFLYYGSALGVSYLLLYCRDVSFCIDEQTQYNKASIFTS